MSLLNKKLNIICKLRRENENRIKGLSVRCNELKAIQKEQHLKILDTNSGNIQENLKQYIFGNNIFRQTENLGTTLYAIQKEQEMLVNLFIEYTKQSVIPRFVSNTFISRKEKINIIQAIYEDQLLKNNQTYCSILIKKINTYQANDRMFDLYQ